MTQPSDNNNTAGSETDFITAYAVTLYAVLYEAFACWIKYSIFQS